MKQGIFEVFGDGPLGLKADDLNNYSEIMTKVGLIVPEGIVVTTEIFNLLTRQIDFEKVTEETENINCPDFVLSINKAILDKMEIGVPYAIRSSALSERGGTGIYKSTFFMPTGNTDDDLSELWYCELIVYKSEFTKNAKLWREKINLPIGMAILIQKVVIPVLSGTAYTSYNGLPTVRTVIGMGTKAVNGGGMIDHQAYDNFLNFQRNLWDQKYIDVITTTGEVTQISSQDEEIHNEIFHNFKTFNNLFEILSQLKKYGNFYLEWVISKNQISIVQCATHEDSLPCNMAINLDDYFLLLNGNDVVHSGRSNCQCIILVDNWSTQVSTFLEHLNKNTKDYLLIVPQDALSQLADIDNQNRLDYRHFSNAKTVVEMQRSFSQEQRSMLLQARLFLADHSSGMGATHFAQVCQQSDILFVGGQFDLTPLLKLPGGMELRRGLGVTVWKTNTEVLVDAVKKEGFVYISKHPKVNKFSIYQLQDWTDILRTIALEYETINKEMSDHLFNVHYTIIPNSNPIEFDPFKINMDDSEIESCGGIDEIKKSLEVIILNGKHLVDPYTWNSGLKEYLEQLLSHLVNT